MSRDNKGSPVENMVDHVLLSFHSVVAGHGDDVVVLRCVTFSCCDVVGVRAVGRYATSFCNGTEGSQIVAAGATWLRISAGVHVSAGAARISAGVHVSD